MPSRCWQDVSELLSEFFMSCKSSGLTAELVLHCFLFEQRHLNCLHVSSCSHFLPQIFPFAKCPSQSFLLNLGVQLLRPGLLSPQPADKFSCNDTVPSQSFSHKQFAFCTREKWLKPEYSHISNFCNEVWILFIGTIGWFVLSMWYVKWDH